MKTKTYNLKLSATQLWNISSLLSVSKEKGLDGKTTYGGLSTHQKSFESIEKAVRKLEKQSEEDYRKVERKIRLLEEQGYDEKTARAVAHAQLRAGRL